MLHRAMEEYEETAWSSMSQFENHFNELDAAFHDNIQDTDGK